MGSYLSSVSSSRSASTNINNSNSVLGARHDNDSALAKTEELKKEIERLKREHFSTTSIMKKTLADERASKGSMEQQILLLETGCVGAIAMGVGLFFFLSKRNSELLRQMGNLRQLKEDAEVLVHEVRRRSKIDSEKEGWEKLKKANKDFLEVADNLDFSCQHAQTIMKDAKVLSAKADIMEVKKDALIKLVDGLTMTSSGLHKVLHKHHVKEITADVGDKFDPAFHNAISMIEQSGAKGSESKDGLGYISQVVQKGYLLMGNPATVLRPSTVIVSPTKIDNKQGSP